jgi:hypothetical protein
MSRKCYNCGLDVTRKNQSKEHIPAQALFTGYPYTYKIKRISVTSCKACNNYYSSVDEEFRNLIGVINNSPERETITKKSIWSNFQFWKKQNRLRFDTNGRVSGVEFDTNQIELFHKKNFKGIFYKEYGYPISNDFDIVVDINEGDWRNGLLSSIGYLQDHFNWKISGHKDIFHYIIQPFRENLSNGIQKDIKPSETDSHFLALLKYNQSYVAFVGARRTRN